MTAKLTQKVFEQFLDVREIGEVNMFDRSGVQVVADRIGAYELVVWLEDNKKDYGSLVMGDYEIVEEAAK